MSYDCPKCGAIGVISTAEGKCSKCGWGYKYRWHDHPLFNENIIAVCIVLILLLYLRHYP